MDEMGAKPYVFSRSSAAGGGLADAKLQWICDRNISLYALQKLLA